MANQYLTTEGLDALIENTVAYTNQEVANNGVHQYTTKTEFPSVGIAHNAIYLDQTNQRFYRWDDNNLVYVPCTKDITEELTGAILNGGE